MGVSILDGAKKAMNYAPCSSSSFGALEPFLNCLHHLVSSPLLDALSNGAVCGPSAGGRCAVVGMIAWLASESIVRADGCWCRS